VTNQHMTFVLGLVPRQSYKLFTFSNNKTIWSNHLASDIQTICYNCKPWMYWHPGQTRKARS